MSEEKKGGETQELKFKLRAGLRATNVEVYEEDGSRKTVRVEPGIVYRGEKFLRWVPMILTPLPETMKAGLPPTPEPPMRRGRRRLRPGLASIVTGTEATKSGAVATPTATLTKKDPAEATEKSETDKDAERGKPPTEPEGKTPEQEAAEKKADEQPPTEPPETEKDEDEKGTAEPPDPGEDDEWADYEEPEITSKTDLRKMKKADLLKLAEFHDYDVNDEEYDKGDLLDVLFEHYGLD